MATWASGVGGDMGGGMGEVRCAAVRVWAAAREGGGGMGDGVRWRRHGWWKALGAMR